MSTLGRSPMPAPAVILLAAGRAQRMGRVKALLPLRTLPDGTTQSALAALAQRYRDLGMKDIFVVDGFHASLVEREAEALGLSVVRNPQPEKGMFSSVCVGLSHLASCGGFAAAFLHPVDIPLVRPLTLWAMLAAYAQCGEDEPAVLVPTFHGREGHPPLIPACHFRPILAHKSTDGLRGALVGLARHTVPVADALMLEDMDTPDEYLRLRRLAPWMEALFPREALVLLCLQGVAHDCQRHSLAVGLVAAAFAAALARAQRARGRSPACRSWLALSGGLLHDIAKGRPQHAAAGAALLESLGLSRMASMVGSHSDLTLPDAKPFTERELVYLADKYCQGTDVVSLTCRFAQKTQTFVGHHAAKATFAERCARARHMEARLWRETGSSPADMARAALHDVSWQRIFS